MSKLFTENVIAILWDFDCTLIPGYMQDPLFERYRVDAQEFWRQVRSQAEQHQQNGIQVLKELIYLNQILSYVKAGRFHDLNNQRLKELGQGINFYEGLPDFLGEIKQRVNHADKQAAKITVEHYVLSSGLRKMIEGSAIAQYLDGIWACEFVESKQAPHVLEKIVYVIDHTTKTRAVFEINKGANVDPDIDVNATMPEDERRVPIQQMIYVGDGPSDVPVFSVINERKGHTLAVYNPRSDKAYKQAYQLNEEKRVNHYAKAVFTTDSEAGSWLLHTVDKLAEQIRERHQREVKEQVGKPLEHTHDHNR